MSGNVYQFPLERKYAEEAAKPLPENLAGTREERLAAEMKNQRYIRRPGTPDRFIERMAIDALMERGEW